MAATLANLTAASTAFEPAISPFFEDMDKSFTRRDALPRLNKNIPTKVSIKLTEVVDAARERQVNKHLRLTFMLANDARIR